MVRQLVQFTEAQSKALRAESRRRRKPVAALVRESVDAYLASSGPTAPALDKWERAKRVVGFARSGEKDISINHDKYLAQLKSW